MKKIPDRVLIKFEALAKDVISNLKRKGHVVPMVQDDGSIKFDNFSVRKQNNFYYILDKNQQVVVDQINLAQTAVVLAHGLALGRILDSEIISLDKEYGYRMFDEEVYFSAANRKKISLDQVIFYRTRAEIARVQKGQVKTRILDSFRKLTSIA